MKDCSDANQGGLGAYLKGFLGALLLTLLAFGLATAEAGLSFAPIDSFWKLLPVATAIKELPHGMLAGSVVSLAILQMLVHLRFFLHLHFNLPLNWNLRATLFAFIIIVIMVVGTIWIMHDLRSHMVHTTMRSDVHY